MSRAIVKNITISTGVVFIMGVALILLTAKTTAAIPVCTLGACPKTLNAQNSEGVYTYKTGRRFNVILNSAEYPDQELNCFPEGVVSKYLTMPDRVTPNYVQRFEAAATGQCELTDKNFKVTIVVTDTTPTANQISQNVRTQQFADTALGAVRAYGL